MPRPLPHALLLPLAQLWVLNIEYCLHTPNSKKDMSSIISSHRSPNHNHPSSIIKHPSAIINQTSPSSSIHGFLIPYRYLPMSGYVGARRSTQPSQGSQHPSITEAIPYHTIAERSHKWTQKPCIPICLHTTFGAHYITTVGRTQMFLSHCTSVVVNGYL